MKDKTDASNPFVEDISQRSTSQSQLAEAGEPSKSEQQTIQLQSQEMAPSHDTIEEHPASDMEKINLQDRCRLEVLNRSSSRRGRFELNFMLHTKLNDIAYLAHANDELYVFTLLNALSPVRSTANHF
jgi:hypothetical protein